MAVFTYIATAVVTYVTGAAVVAGTWAAFAVSVIATGLAAATARIFGVGRAGGGGGGRDQGVRIQLPPSTENKIPIIYGSVYQQGIITDARISNENQTMSYVITLAEYTTSGNYTCDAVYWNDQRLVFRADGYTVEKSIQSDGAENTNLADKVRVWVYAGGSGSASQILGPSPAVNAYDTIGADSLYQMSDLVFAVVQLDYSSEKGITGLPTMTFKITNDLKNPALVWYDYVSNTRYGAGFTATEINTSTSIDTANTLSLYSISNEIPSYQYSLVSSFLGSISTNVLTVDSVTTGTIDVGYRLSGPGVPDDVFISAQGSGTGGTGTYTISVSTSVSTRILATTTGTQQVRYEINGVLNTGDTVKTNMEKINLASASWTTYNYKTGQWQIVSNRAASASELNAAYVFNDDNIIGEISLTSSNLEDLYNQVEAGFASRAVRDQTDYYKRSLPQEELNSLEPANRLQMTVQMVNNPIHAGRIANIELNQNRYDLLISFTADYGALVCEVGDVVKVTNAVYGFDNKLFRITRIRETELEDATLASEITALEYSASVYADSTLTDLTFTPLTDIPTSGTSSSQPPPGVPVLTTGTGFASIEIASTIASTSIPVSQVDFYYSNTTTGSIFPLTSVVANTVFVANDVVSGLNNTLPAGTYYFKARTFVSGSYSDFSGFSTAFYTDGPYTDYGGITGEP